MSLIEKEFSDTLSILTDFQNNLKLIIAFSGGADSLALLTLCIKTLGTNRIFPVYVNHNLRDKTELDKELDLNFANCKKLGVKLTVKNVEPGEIVKNSKKIGIEAAARKVRYEILEQERIEKECDYILTAHHRDDQIETVLMRIIKGSPITGLRGIKEKNGKIIRPLLEFSKKDLTEYLKNIGFEYCTDSSNSNNYYTRNEIRNVILPELKTVMPDCENRILRLRNYAVSECVDVGKIGDSISVDVFRNLSKAQKIMVLFSMWDEILGTSLPQTLQNRVLDRIEREDSICESSNNGTFFSHNGILHLVNDLETKNNSDFCCRFEETCQKYILPYGIFIEKICESGGTKLFIDFSKFSGMPHIRFSKDGEVIHLKDGSKTVGKLLQDMKIPETLRRRVPVIADDEGLCVVFGSVFGGKDRISGKMRSSLAPHNYIKYISYKGGVLKIPQR